MGLLFSPIGLVDPDDVLQFKFIYQVVKDGEELTERLVYFQPVTLRHPHPPRLQRWERYVEMGFSETCAGGLVIAGTTPASVGLANNAKSTLESAANAQGIDWRLLTAIRMVMVTLLESFSSRRQVVCLLL